MASKPSMSINLGLQPAPDTDSPELFGALMPLYNAIRNTMYTVDAYTGNTLIDKSDYSEVNAFGQLLLQKTAVLYVKATEDISAGHMINLWNSGGLRARKAVGGSTRAHAFAISTATAGEHIAVSLFGLCPNISGLAPGTEYYLSTTAGLVTPTATHHRVGVAVDATKLWFAP
jgi:hypothetical protein